MAKTFSIEQPLDTPNASAVAWLEPGLMIGEIVEPFDGQPVIIEAPFPGSMQTTTSGRVQQAYCVAPLPEFFSAFPS
jgi:hypothetical protein